MINNFLVTKVALSKTHFFSFSLSANILHVVSDQQKKRLTVTHCKHEMQPNILHRRLMQHYTTCDKNECAW